MTKEELEEGLSEIQKAIIDHMLDDLFGEKTDIALKVLTKHDMARFIELAIQCNTEDELPAELRQVLQDAKEKLDDERRA